MCLISSSSLLWKFIIRLHLFNHPKYTLYVLQFMIIIFITVPVHFSEVNLYWYNILDYDSLDYRNVIVALSDGSSIRILNDHIRKLHAMNHVSLLNEYSSNNACRLIQKPKITYLMDARLEKGQIINIIIVLLAICVHFVKFFWLL